MVPSAEVDSSSYFFRFFCIKVDRCPLASLPSTYTVNRTLEVVRAMLRKAANEWDWFVRAPMMLMLPEPKRRVRWITGAQAERLLAELPSHRAMAKFSLETELRKSNAAYYQAPSESAALA